MTSAAPANLSEPSLKEVDIFDRSIEGSSQIVFQWSRFTTSTFVWLPYRVLDHLEASHAVSISPSQATLAHYPALIYVFEQRNDYG